MSVAIRVENLSKRYRLGKGSAGKTFREALTDNLTPFKKSDRKRNEEFWALKDIDFEVEQGEVVGIIGRNGAGKSTLLKILSRITEPTTGSVTMKGRVGSLLEVGTGFHPELTGRENIYLNGAILGMKRREIDAKFDEIVAFAEVETFLDTPVKHYSSGMYVRLAFAVAAHLEPEILIVDEVLAVGDAAFQKKCLGKMSDVAKEGRTVLFVSHSLFTINQLCTRSLLLSDGKIKRVGKTRAVLEAYASEDRHTSSFWKKNDKTPIQNNIELLEAKGVSDSGVQTNVFEFNESAGIEIDYAVRSDIPGWALVVRITDSFDNPILTSWDIDSLTNKRARPNNIYRVKCSLPPAVLKPGTYSVTIAIHIPKQKTVEMIENAFNFEVLSTGYTFPEGRIGVITPILSWRCVDEWHLES